MCGDLGKSVVAKGFKKLPKVQLIAQSGHTVGNAGVQLGAAASRSEEDLNPLSLSSFKFVRPQSRTNRFVSELF